MPREALLELFERDLKRLKTEVDAHHSETALWLVKGDIKNSAGNLCLHLVGNLKHFIGAILGNSAYVRNRDLEFNARNVPRAEIALMIDETTKVVTSTLPGLSDDELAAPYPIEVFGKEMTTAFFLIHLHSHLNYHLGQINYHRRLPDT